MFQDVCMSAAHSLEASTYQGECVWAEAEMGVPFAIPDEGCTGTVEGGLNMGMP